MPTGSPNALSSFAGEPNFSPDGQSVRSHAEYIEGNTLKEMIKEDLIAERVAIESYREMVAYIAEKRSDNTSPP